MLLTALLLLSAAEGPALGPPAAMEAAKLRELSWMACVLEQSFQFAKLDDEASTIAIASMQKCENFALEYEQSLNDVRIDGSVKLSQNSKNKIMLSHRNKYRAIAITNVLEARLNQSTPNGGQ